MAASTEVAGAADAEGPRRGRCPRREQQLAGDGARDPPDRRRSVAGAGAGGLAPSATAILRLVMRADSSCLPLRRPVQHHRRLGAGQPAGGDRAGRRARGTGAARRPARATGQPRRRSIERARALGRWPSEPAGRPAPGPGRQHVSTPSSTGPSAGANRRSSSTASFEPVHRPRRRLLLHATSGPRAIQQFEHSLSVDRSTKTLLVSASSGRSASRTCRAQRRPGTQVVAIAPTVEGRREEGPRGRQARIRRDDGRELARAVALLPHASQTCSWPGRPAPLDGPCAARRVGRPARPSRGGAA